MGWRLRGRRPRGPAAAARGAARGSSTQPRRGRARRARGPCPRRSSLRRCRILEGEGVLPDGLQGAGHDAEEERAVAGREHLRALVQGGLGVEGDGAADVAPEVEAEEGALVLPGRGHEGDVRVLHEEPRADRGRVAALHVGLGHGQVARGGVGGGAHQDDARPRGGHPVEARGEGPLLLEGGVEGVLRRLEAVGRVPGEARAPGDALLPDAHAHLLPHQYCT